MSETKMIVLPDTENRMFVSLLDKTPERDGQTDGQTELPWLLQRLHCEQCGRAVKTDSDSDGVV